MLYKIESEDENVYVFQSMKNTETYFVLEEGQKIWIFPYSASITKRWKKKIKIIEILKPSSKKAALKYFELIIGDMIIQDHIDSSKYFFIPRVNDALYYHAVELIYLNSDKQFKIYSRINFNTQLVEIPNKTIVEYLSNNKGRTYINLHNIPKGIYELYHKDGTILEKGYINEDIYSLLNIKCEDISHFVLFYSLDNTKQIHIEELDHLTLKGKFNKKDIKVTLVTN